MYVPQPMPDPMPLPPEPPIDTDAAFNRLVRAIADSNKELSRQLKLAAELDSKELTRRFNLAIDYEFENPEDAVHFLQYAENFEYELGMLARSGRLPMKNRLQLD